MKKGNLIRATGILLYVGISILDKFCFKIADYIYIPLALVSIILLVVGLIVSKKEK